MRKILIVLIIGMAIGLIYVLTGNDNPPAQTAPTQAATGAPATTTSGSSATTPAGTDGSLPPGLARRMSRMQQGQ